MKRYDIIMISISVLYVQWSAASIPWCNPAWRCRVTVTSSQLAVTSPVLWDLTTMTT